MERFDGLSVYGVLEIKWLPIGNIPPIPPTPEGAERVERTTLVKLIVISMGNLNIDNNTYMVNCH